MNLDKRKIALVKVLITAMLWGTTNVLISMGLEEMGPLTLAGIRYTLAGLILLPVIRFSHIKLREYKSYFWQLTALGIFSLTLGNGFVSFALQHLPSTSVSLLSNLTAPLVMIAGIAFLNESTSPLQAIGVAVVLGGMVLYLNPGEFSSFNIGYLFLTVSLISFTIYNLMGRYMASSGTMPFLIQTAIPFIIGGGIMLSLALLFEGIPVLSAKAILIILFMVVFNSITGFTLYNQALAELSAIEVNIILKLSPFFTALYAWLLLGERITFLQVIAMCIVFVGIYMVQRGPARVISGKEVSDQL